MAAARYVAIALVTMLAVAAAKYWENPCCPGSPYNGENVKMNMLQAIYRTGQMNTFIWALSHGCRVHSQMPKLFSYRQYTLLIPTDDAFRAMDQDTWQGMIVNNATMVDFLYLHYIRNSPPLTFDDLDSAPDGTEYTTIACNFQGHVTKVDGGYSVYGSTPANIVMQDVWMEGVSVQGIDRVLLPSDIYAAPECLQKVPLI